MTIIRPRAASHQLPKADEPTGERDRPPPRPFRFVAYLDTSQADLLGLAGVTNTLSVNPTPETSLSDLQRHLFSDPVVASVQRADGVAELLRDFLGQFVGILQVAEGASVLLILLIAFNSASVAFDERAREHATMMAYGVKRRAIMRMAIIESGVLACSPPLSASWVASCL